MVLTLLHHPGQGYYTVTLTPGDTTCHEAPHTSPAMAKLCSPAARGAARQGTLRAASSKRAQRGAAAAGRGGGISPGHSPSPPVPLDALLALLQHEARHLQQVEEGDADDVGDGVVEGQQALPEPAGWTGDGERPRSTLVRACLSSRPRSPGPCVCVRPYPTPPPPARSPGPWVSGVPPPPVRVPGPTWRRSRSGRRCAGGSCGCRS